MTVPSWHQQNAQEGSKTMNSKPTTGLGNFRRVLRENISLVTLFLQPPPGFQIQDLQSKHSHPHLLQPLQGWDLENCFISEALK